MKKDYFEEEEEVDHEQSRVFYCREDYSGRKFHGWIILSKQPNSKYNYNVRCRCGKEYIRHILSILNGRSSKCISCSKKLKMLWVPARLEE